MKTCGKLFVGLLMLVVFGCDLSEDDNGFLVFSKSFDFSISQDEWQVDFTDFPSGPNDSSYYELKFAYTDRPSNLGENQKSIMISGNNYSDDLFMFMKKKLTGLNPNTDYALVFEIELASNAPKGIVTAGGAPGDSVYLKAGATGTEPKKVIEGNQYTLNIDKGYESDPGENTVVLGNIASSYGAEEYSLITRNSASGNNSPLIAKSNSKGEMWLIVGTDSSFEGITTVYYTRVNVVFSAVN